MYDLPLRFRTLIKTKRPLGYYLEVAWVRLQPLAVPTLAVGTFVLGGVAGLLATKLSLEVTLLAIAGLAVVLVALSRPDLVILLMLAMSSTVINHKSIPRIEVGFSFTAIEMCLVFLLGLVVLRALSNKGENDLVRTPLDWPVFLFFVASLISLLNAMYILERHRSLLISAWRVLFNYMVFFAVTNLVRTRRQLMTLVGGMLVMATIVAALMVAQQVVGPSVSIIPGGQVGTAGALGQSFADVARVMITGSALVYVMLLPTLILHVTPGYLKQRKWLSFIPVVLLPLAIAFTFDRNLWIGTVLSSAIFVILVRREGKDFISLILVLAIAVSLFVPLLGAYLPRVDSIVEALSMRAGSLFAGDELVYDASTQWRLRENEHAIAKIREYPVFGIGPGGEYRAPWFNGDVSTFYIHNAYLYLLVDVGIVGFLPFLWFSVVYLLRGFSSWYTIQDPVLKGLVIGFSLSYMAVLSSSMTSPRLLEMQFIPLLGVMLGVNEVAIRLERQSSR